jgi:hypothetical protein
MKVSGILRRVVRLWRLTEVSEVPAASTADDSRLEGSGWLRAAVPVPAFAVRLVVPSIHIRWLLSEMAL